MCHMIIFDQRDILLDPEIRNRYSPHERNYPDYPFHFLGEVLSKIEFLLLVH